MSSPALVPVFRAPSALVLRFAAALLALTNACSSDAPVQAAAPAPPRSPSPPPGTNEPGPAFDASVVGPPATDAGSDGSAPTDAGDGGDAGLKNVPPSCAGAAATTTCGLAGDESCCASLPVPGGSYHRFSDASYPATVSAFRLDRYEITVARVRAFFQAKAGNPRGAPPAPGAGAHPRIANSGWRAAFDVRLPGSWTEIDDRLGAAGCTVGGDNTDGGAATWTHTPGPYESLPITCIDWYTLFAFCAWDGGRLPTDAEWGFAAMGGAEQRPYAWSKPGDPGIELTWGIHDDVVVASLWDPGAQLFKFSAGTPFRAADPSTGKTIDGPSHMTPPGRKTGYGKWGHADLTGNVLEYLLDTAPLTPGACIDCASVDWPDPPQDQAGVYPPQWYTPGTNQSPDGFRSVRGGSWDPTHVPYTHYYYAYGVPRTYYAAGGRCARD